MPALSYQEIYQMLTAVRDERRTHANTATRIGEALLALLAYLADAPYLRNDQADSTNFILSLLAGAVIGESGQIKLNPDGSISCQGLSVEGSAIFNELVFNHQNVLEGDTFFTDKGIIETLEYQGESRYLLTMRKEHDNDITTFRAYDVLRCSMNNLDVAKTYKTSWMRVNAVDTTANTLDVTLYDNEDVSGGINYPPEATAKLVRWGNQSDESRQQCFYISSNDGRVVFLQGVTKPMLDDSNYSAFIGLPPDLDFLKNQPLNRNHPYIYARGLIYQDLIKVDYLGNPVYTARDRGIWDKDTQYIHGYDEVEKGYFTDRVWWGGCLWQAAVEKPTLGKEPRYNNADWLCLIGGANMTMEIVSSEGEQFRAGTRWTTKLVAVVKNAEMLISEDEIGKENITWQRISDDTEGDVAWNIKHAAGTQGLTLEIDSEIDIPGEWTAGSCIGFQCDIYIPEKGSTYSAQYTLIN